MHFYVLWLYIHPRVASLLSECTYNTLIFSVHKYRNKKWVTNSKDSPLFLIIFNIQSKKDAPLFLEPTLG